MESVRREVVKEGIDKDIQNEVKRKNIERNELIRIENEELCKRFEKQCKSITEKKKINVNFVQRKVRGLKNMFNEESKMKFRFLEENSDLKNHLKKQEERYKRFELQLNEQNNRINEQNNLIEELQLENGKILMKMKKYSHKFKSLKANLNSFCHCCNKESTKLWKCKGCEITYYCSRKCQKNHYPKHKKFCRMVEKHKKLQKKKEEEKKEKEEKGEIEYYDPNQYKEN